MVGVEPEHIHLLQVERGEVLVGAAALGVNFVERIGILIRRIGGIEKIARIDCALHQTNARAREARQVEGVHGAVAEEPAERMARFVQRDADEIRGLDLVAETGIAVDVALLVADSSPSALACALQTSTVE